MPSSHDRSRLGRYVLEDCLGFGGFGVVYKAYDEELDRHVAIKFVLPNGVDLRAAERLMLEGRAMAQLSHPNVVNVFDVGRFDVRESSEPWPHNLPSNGVYVVMELVEGQNLSGFLDEERPWQDVLSLFIAAGKGLAAAHARGILHRDFKPSNVLIGEDERPRVVDFGLARVFSGPATSDLQSSESSELVDVSTSARTDSVDVEGSTKVVKAANRPVGSPLTATGLVMGTPPYMAPEQRGPRGIGPWSDQYNFCVALYEGLFGERPFPSEAEGMWKHKLEGDVRPIPSTSPVPAGIRNAILRGLRPHPDQRWPSMDALLQALAPRPVRRWWIPTVAVVAGGAAAITLIVDEDQRCANADERVLVAWDRTRRDAVREAIISTGTEISESSADRVVRAIDGYVEDWAESTRLACEGRTRRDGADFDQTMRCLAESLSGVESLSDLLTEADNTLAMNAMRAVASLPAPGTCLDDPGHDDGLDSEDPDEVAAIERELLRVSLLRQAGRPRQSLEAAVRATALARELGSESLTARGLLLCGYVQLELGDLESAETSFKEGYYMATEIHDEREAAAAAAHLVMLFGDLRSDELGAQQWIRHAETHLERLGGDLGVESSLASSLGFMAENRGDLKKAVEHYRRARNLLIEKYGDDHIKVALTQQNLGRALFDAGEHQEGLDTITQGLTTAQGYLGPKHPHLMPYHSALGNSYLRLGEYDKALSHAQVAVEVVEAGYGTRNQDYAGQAMNLANIYTMVGQYEDAQRLYQSALDTVLEVQGSDSPVISLLNINLGQVHLMQDEPTRAQAAFERALATLEVLHGPEHRDLAEALNGIGRALLHQRKYDEARSSHLEALELQVKTLGSQHFEVSRTLHDIGLTYLESGRHAEAIPRFEKSLAMREVADVDPLFVAESQLALAQSKFGTGDPEDDGAALEHARKARDIVNALGPSADILRPDLEDVLRSHDPEFTEPEP